MSNPFNNERSASHLARYHPPGRPDAAYWASDRHPKDQDASTCGRLGLRDLHQQLAEVLALEQAKERGRRVLQALGSQ